MADLKTSFKEIMQIPGNLGSALVDTETGMCVAQIGVRSSNFDMQADYYAKYLRAKEQLIDRMGLDEGIEEVVITSELYYHMIYPVRIRILKVRKPESFFFFVTLAKTDVSLAQARARIKKVVAEFEI